MRELLGALLVSTLLVITALPAAGDETAGNGPIPIRGGSGRPSGGDVLDDGGDEGGPEPPQLPEIVVPPLTPPDPNLVVSLLHPDRDVVQVSHPLHVYVTVENVGYRFLDNATVSLYEGTSPGLLIDEKNVVLRDFEGAADFSWLPMTIGNRTLRAVADPHGYVQETNETDNEASTTVLVTQNPPIGKPDLAVVSTDISPLAAVDFVANVTAYVDIRVWNTGDRVAQSVVVQVWEVERTMMVASYMIVSEPPGGQDTHTIAWTPNAPGPWTLEVRADPYNLIPEHNETNNVASEGFHVRPPVILRIADPPHILPWCPGAIVWGDWYIPAGFQEYVYDCYVRVLGNVIVDGTLILYDSTVALAAMWNNQYRVEVRTGGVLSFNTSKLCPMRQSYGISFLADAGSTLHFRAGSEARWLYGTPHMAYPVPGPGGLQVYTSNTWIQGSTVRDGQTHGIYVGPGTDAGAIVGNTLANNPRGAGIVLDTGANASVQSNILTGDRFGVWAIGSSPEIVGNVVQGNEYGLQFYGPTSTRLEGNTNTISGNAVGIMLSHALEGPWVTMEGINVTNSMRIGVAALNSNLSLVNSSIWRNLGTGGLGADIEYSIGGQRFMPEIVGNYVATHHLWPLVVRNVLAAAIRDNNFTFSSHGTWAIDSGAVSVTNNSWRDAVGPDSCYQYVDLRSSSDLSRNTFYPGASACTIAVRSAGSTTRSRNDTFLAGDPGVYYYGMVNAILGDQGSYVEVDNATIENANNGVVLTGASGIVKYSNFTRVARGDLGFSGVQILDAVASSLVAHNRFNDYRFGVGVVRSSAVVEGNVGLQRYFPPGFPWVPGSWLPDNPNWCHICDYGSIVIARNNSYSGGSFGISVESSAGASGPVYSHLDAYNNTFNATGYQAIVSSEAGTNYDLNEMLVVGNRAFNVSSSAYGTITAGNATFLDNTVDGCDGYAGGYIDTWYGCTWVRPGNRDPTGRIEFRGNVVTHANMSAMRANTQNRVVHFFNNTVDCVRCDDPRTYLNESGIDVWGLPTKHSVVSRVENNTVTRAYMGLRIGIWTSDYLGRPYIAGAWVNASYNNFTGNRRYGISILNQTGDTTSVTKTSLWWNDLTENTVGGLFVQFSPPSGQNWTANCNWWGNATGPYDPTDPVTGPPDWNPFGTGQYVSDYVWYRNATANLWWLRQPSRLATTCAPP